MSEYIITKRTECDTCHGEQQYIYSKDAPDTKFALACSDCNGFGQIATAIDADEWLLDRLAKLRWNEKWGEHTGTTKEMSNPRFEGGEG